MTSQETDLYIHTLEKTIDLDDNKVAVHYSVFSDR